MGLDAMILAFFFNVEFQASFFALLFYPHWCSLVPLHFLLLKWYHLLFWGCYYFLEIFITACDSLNKHSDHFSRGKLKLQHFGHLMERLIGKNSCSVRLRAGGEGADRGWDGWIALPTQWIGVWANSEDSDRGAWCAAINRVTMSQTWHRNWKTTTKQGFTMQPYHAPFLILNQSTVLCLVLTVAFWSATSFSGDK